MKTPCACAQGRSGRPAGLMPCGVALKLYEENYRTEYREVAAAWRFYASLRFIVVAFTATIQSALFTLYQQRAATLTTVSTLSTRLLQDASVVAFIGVLSMTAIIIIEYRTVEFIKLFLRRGAELEFRMGLTGGHFHCLKELTFLRPAGLKIMMTHTGGLLLIYLSMLIVWYMFYFTTL